MAPSSRGPQGPLAAVADAARVRCPTTSAMPSPPPPSCSSRAWRTVAASRPALATSPARRTASSSSASVGGVDVVRRLEGDHAARRDHGHPRLPERRAAGRRPQQGPRPRPAGRRRDPRPGRRRARRGRGRGRERVPRPPRPAPVTEAGVDDGRGRGGARPGPRPATPCCCRPPAPASTGTPSYGERGDDFARLVHELQGVEAMTGDHDPSRRPAADVGEGQATAVRRHPAATVTKVRRRRKANPPPTQLLRAARRGVRALHARAGHGAVGVVDRRTAPGQLGLDVLQPPGAVGLARRRRRSSIAYRIAPPRRAALIRPALLVVFAVNIAVARARPRRPGQRGQGLVRPRSVRLPALGAPEARAAGLRRRPAGTREPTAWATCGPRSAP